MSDRITYRELRRYKYQLTEEYGVTIDIHPQEDIELKYIGLSSAGRLRISQYYAWDGPSGPTIDTKSFMRGSLVHDALYQLMRLKKLDCQTHRERTDQILCEICKEDGMCALRRWYVYRALRTFGAPNAHPCDEPEEEIITAP